MIALLLDRIVRLVVEHPRRVGLGLIGISVLAGLALLSFRIEPDMEKMLPADHEGIELRRVVEAGVDTQRSLLIGIEGENVAACLPEVAATLEESPFLARVIATRDGFVGPWAEALRAAPLVAVPESTLDRLERRLTAPERSATIAALPDRIAEDPFVGLELVRRDPLGLRWIFDEAGQALTPEKLDPVSPYLVTRDGATAFVQVRGREKPYDLDFSRQLLADIEARIGAIDHPIDGTRFIGSYAAARADADRITDDLWLSCFVAMTLIFIFLTVSTRRRLDPPMLLFPTSLVIFWTMAFGGWLLGPLSPIATSAAPVLSGLSVDIAIHYLGRYRRERRLVTAAEAVRNTTRALARPLFVGTLTSMAAFASLTTTRFEGFFGFGALLALGLALALGTTLFALPLLLAHRRERDDEGEPASSPVLALAKGLVRSRAALPATALILLAAVIGWGWVATRGLEFDADPRRLRPIDDPMAKSTEWLEGALGFSPIPITVLVPAETPVATCQAAVAELERAGEVQMSLGVHRLLPTPERRQALAAFHRTTDGWVDAAGHELDAAGLNADAIRPTLEEFDHAISLDPAPPPELTRIEWRDRAYWRLTLFPASTHWRTHERAAFDGALRDAFGERGEEILAVAPFGLADDLTSLLTEDLLRCAGFATIAVLLLVLLLGGGLKFGAVSLLPTATGLGMVLGGMAWLDAPIHLGNLVAIPFLIGLGVDDGVHIVARHREGASMGELIDTSGHSVWRTSVTSFLGFGSLAFASSPGLASLGWVMASGIAVCFVTSVVVLPVVLGMRAFRVER